MHIPTKSGVLNFLRIAQLVLAVGFLVLVCWCGVHRGWWDNINGALAVGVISSILTFGLSAFSIFSHYRSSSPFSNSTKKLILHVVIEVVLILIYIAAAGLMLRPKDGCITDSNFPNRCFYRVGNDLKPTGDVYDHQPLTEWDVAIVFSFVQIVSYFVSLLLVFLENRSSSKVVGSSYA